MRIPVIVFGMRHEITYCVASLLIYSFEKKKDQKISNYKKNYKRFQNQTYIRKCNPFHQINRIKFEQKDTHTRCATHKKELN